ncbi:hypothetical protein QCA50_004706 [Cerrena zonata]|uniref:Ricin B lectin domain-containing protein n=1 Tax=Cerrena zonata TaxID=2478898 RepID=A0AAW0GFE3_9APHY
MIGKLILQVALITASAYTAVARPTLPVPISGTYRILNIGSGLFLDDLESEQTMGAPVVVRALNRPLTLNQEWNLVVFNGQFSTLQSVSSFINTDGATGVILNPSGAAALSLTSAPSGIFICALSSAVGCLTSPLTSAAPVTFAPLAGGLDQTWSFELVG